MKGEKTGGRTKGTPNKTQAEIREKFQLLLEDNLEELKNDLKQLKPVERIKCILDLSRFVVPHLKAIELSGKDENKPVIIIDLGKGTKPEDED